jgi:Raf kinase inhibitor-like YbhB/YbcL family protein
MRSRWLMSILVVALATVLGVGMSAQQQERGGGAGGGGGRGGGRGFNLPPLLMQSDASEGTVSYAIIFHDIDVALQGGTGDVLHWMAWNIPAAAGGIPEGKLPEGSVQGANLTGQNAYMGPGAPNGPRYHHYVFELYALNSNLDLPPNASRDDLIKAMAGKTTAKAAYVGRYRNETAPAK